MVMAKGFHLFPSRTQKLRPSAPMVLGWTRPGRVGRRRIPKESGVEILRFPIFLSSSMAEHSAVNRVVVGSSPTWGATPPQILRRFLFIVFCCVFMRAYLPIPAYFLVFLSIPRWTHEGKRCKGNNRTWHKV